MILVGVDAGATRTRVAVWRDGELLQREEGPGAAIRPGRVLQSAAAIAGLAKTALARSGFTRGDTLVVGAAGAGRAPDADELRAALRGERIADRVTVTTDVALALESLPPGPAILLLAGTGSVVVAREADGTVVRRGGLGWQMGDEGSAYWVGREALEAAGKAGEGRGPVTALTDRLLGATGSPDVRELAGWAANASPREVAGLAQIVAAAADDGDAVAQAILSRAADELVELVAGLGRSERVVHVGGGMLAEGRLRERVMERLAAAGHRVIDQLVDPLAGAAALASRSAAP